jgi:ribonuclease J
MLGIDYIIPDYEYLRKRADKVVGIVITHGHEDHIGAIHHVLNDIPVPVYATPLTRGLIEVKLARNNVSGKAMLHTVEAGGSVEIGAFKVEFFHICHSIPIWSGDYDTGRFIVHERFPARSHPRDGWPTDWPSLPVLAGVDRFLIQPMPNAGRT